MNVGYMKLSLGMIALVGASACGDDIGGEIDGDVPPMMEAGAAPLTPIEAEPQTWTWVEFPNTSCADGNPAGIGVSLNPGSTKLFVFLEGGGACWDEETCYGNEEDDPLASNIADGYDERDFELDRGMLFRHAFARGDMENPLRDYNMVFVPYCTGDVHSGDNVVTYGTRVTRHMGGANISAFMARVAVTLPDVDYALLAGRSAGGFGSLGTWHRVKDAFPTVRVDMFDDSGPAPPAESIEAGLYDQWRAAWGYEDAIPADCVGCAGSLDLFFAYYADRYPDHRFALSSFTQDGIIAFFFRQRAEEFEGMLKTILRRHFSPHENLHYFVTPGDRHTMFASWSMIESEGTSMRSWLSQMVSDDADWGSLAPEGYLDE